MLKKIIMFVSLFSILATTILTGMTVQAKTVLAWEFEDGKGEWMWHTAESGGVCNFNLNDGSANTLYNSHDGFWVRTSDLNLDASTVTKITIRIKHFAEGEGADTNGMAMFFTTTDDQNWTETKCNRVVIEPLSVTTEYKEYVFDMAAMDTWTGTIKQLCFSLNPSATRDKQCWLNIDYIRLENNEVDAPVVDDQNPETADVTAMVVVMAACAACALTVVAKKAKRVSR